jgi:pimeloyl-ACP methyl ester carboxylesterase
MRPLALGVLLLVSSGCATLMWVPLPPQAEPHRVQTLDGWALSLVRYPPTVPSTGRPVVLVHGIAANDRNMDLDEHHSMARWFASQGREAWTVSLRGTGSSDEANGKDRPSSYAFDAFWQFDLPAVIDHVKRSSGAASVDYVGHSMGGMVVYAYLSQGGQGIHSAATLGSPTRLDWGTGSEAMIEAGYKFVPPGWALWTAWGAHAVVGLQGLVDEGPFERLFYVNGNTSLESWKRLIAYGTADIASGVAAQFVALVVHGTFASADGQIDFRKDMAKVTTPVLVVAARLDRLALTPAVYDGYRALGGNKQWLLISRANGALAEYGHMDLVVGDRANTEVWTPVLQFFNRHAR